MPVPIPTPIPIPLPYNIAIAIPILQYLHLHYTYIYTYIYNITIAIAMLLPSHQEAAPAKKDRGRSSLAGLFWQVFFGRNLPNKTCQRRPAKQDPAKEDLPVKCYVLLTPGTVHDVGCAWFL